MSILKVILAYVVLSLALSGCLMVREGDLKLPDKWPPQSSRLEKKSISLIVSTAMNPESSNRPASQEAIIEFRDQAVKAYTESGLFSSVQTWIGSADIQADITMVEEGNDALAFASGFITGYTFGLIPGYASEDLTSNTVYKDKEQKMLGRVEKKEKLAIWVGLFFLFAMPFHDGHNLVVNAAHYDLHRATIADAHQRGIF